MHTLLRGHDHYAHACKAKPLTIVGWTSLECVIDIESPLLKVINSTKPFGMTKVEHVLLSSAKLASSPSFSPKVSVCLACCFFFLALLQHTHPTLKHSENQRPPQHTEGSWVAREMGERLFVTLIRVCVVFRPVFLFSRGRASEFASHTVLSSSVAAGS